MAGEQHNDLIYDIGMFNGGDTEYYLHRGYRVVAVEANPVLVEQAKTKFSQQISAGRLNILNVGISETAGQAEFWIDCATPSRSSFQQHIYKDKSEYIVVQIETVSIQDILEEYGPPFFLKIDIEGMDQIVLNQLHDYPLPQFLSTEMQYPSPESTNTILLLHTLGYERFRIVTQKNHKYIYRPNSIDRLLVHIEDTYSALLKRKPWRVKNHRFARFLQFLMAGQQVLVRRQRRIDGDDWVFPPSSSGPLPCEYPTEWLNFEDTLYEWLHMRQGKRHRSKLDGRRNAWFDIHATFTE